jgi:predicted ATPase
MSPSEVPSDPACRCTAESHEPRLVVLTGGPGAGKTAVLEVAKRRFCEHVIVLPEAASIVFGGGFPRYDFPAARRGAQLAIFHVQDQMEGIEVARAHAAVVLCDRGVPDALAYWPGSEADFWRGAGTSLASALARYDAVIHLRTPSADGGYDRRNPLRIETAAEAAAIDARIEAAWSGHPRRVFVPSARDFVEKVRATLDAIEALIPDCCRASGEGHAP